MLCHKLCQYQLPTDWPSNELWHKYFASVAQASLVLEAIVA
jgi:hypothetical protein